MAGCADRSWRQVRQVDAARVEENLGLEQPHRDRIPAYQGLRQQIEEVEAQSGDREGHQTRRQRVEIAQP